MDDTNETKELVYSIINLHELKDFKTLSSHVSVKEIKASTWFTKDRFFEVCEAIQKEIGNFCSLEYIATLNRKTSNLTLWKSTYSKTKDEVLWQITFEKNSNKIILMHINWEQK